MKDPNRQRVVCTSCGWTGGRRAAGDPLATPCAKCGGRVEKVGAVYLEERVLAGCTGCGWWGERPPARVGAGCVKCPAPATVPVMVVTLDGQVLPVP
jgi:hypothetical protein